MPFCGLCLKYGFDIWPKLQGLSMGIHHCGQLNHLAVFNSETFGTAVVCSSITVSCFRSFVTCSKENFHSLKESCPSFPVL